MSFPSRLSRLTRRRWKLIAAGLAVPLIGAGIAALPQPATAVAQPPRAAATASHTITLVTGDVVTVTSLAGGQQTADVDRPDGATGGVRVLRTHGDLYVLPDEALPLLDAGKLDRRLFNVTDLIEMGYDDAKTGRVPLIASFAAGQARTAPKAPPGTTIERRLTSIGGAALKADKKRTHTFWAAVAPATGRPATSFAAGVSKLWLDGRVRANLKESVPQIGAPAAWAAGYDGTGVTVAVLDTGIDATHPDLAGKVDGQQSFVPGEDVTDINGHGTHVASTIVGSGTASGGDYKGVAPGADLLVGKVLGGLDGFGEDSWVMAGMQWAAENGADIVSMSLGDEFASDGLDPMSEAVNTLTAQYGTLFVIAAGNAGPETISAPGAAASALTVGAVDKQDNLAYFSSTGPLVGTGIVKPDISAPGVDITAARSQLMSGGEGWYQTISGTSMATPHVSGAAAILAQRYPDWSAQRLKDALMSSAAPLDEFYSPYEVGTGRLDVAAALARPVQATGSASFGYFDWPHEPGDGPVSRPVTFTNSGASAVTLNLSVGAPFAVAAPSVTVPAGGSAQVTVSGDPTAEGYGRFTGYLIGTDAATGTPVTRTALGLVKEDERYTMNIHLRDRSGAPAKGYVVLNKAGDWFPGVTFVDGDASLRLAPGAYTVTSTVDVAGEGPDRLGVAALVAPEVTLDRTVDVSLDASKARLLDTAAPQRTEDRQVKVDLAVRYADGTDFRSALQIPVAYDDVYVSPTQAMTQGSFEMVTRWRKGEPALGLRAFGVLNFETVMQAGSPLTAGSGQLRTVYAGTGAAGEYAGLDARGKVAVVRRSDAVAPAERAKAAAAAGAAVLIVVNDGIGALSEWVGGATIPVATVHRDEGAKLIQLARSGTKLTVTRTPYPSYVYDLVRTYQGQVPDRPLRYHPRQSELARVDARYYSVKPQEGSGYRYDMALSPSFGFEEREWYPGTRTEWITAGEPWFEVHGQGIWRDTSGAYAYPAGSTHRLDWFAPATRPAFNQMYAVRNGRWRDYLTVNIQAWTPSGSIEHGGFMEWGSTPTNLKLYQGDTLIRENPFASDIQFQEVPSGTLPFRLVLDASRPAEEWRLSTSTHTEWRFVSSSNEADDFVPFALLQLDYALATDLNGDAKAGTVQQIAITAGPQAGGTGTGTVTSVTLDVSSDDGASWQKVTLARGAGGRWVGSLKLPKQPGFLSVRASASTGTGWSIEQEIIRAYGLK